jgi:hypothetical protein
VDRADLDVALAQQAQRDDGGAGVDRDLRPGLDLQGDGDAVALGLDAGDPPDVDADHPHLAALVEADGAVERGGQLVAALPVAEDAAPGDGQDRDGDDEDGDGPAGGAHDGASGVAVMALS